MHLAAESDVDRSIHGLLPSSSRPTYAAPSGGVDIARGGVELLSRDSTVGARALPLSSRPTKCSARSAPRAPSTRMLLPCRASASMGSSGRTTCQGDRTQTPVALMGARRLSEYVSDGDRGTRSSRLGVRRPHHVGDRQGLAGQPDAVGEVLVVEDVVVQHLHLALEQPDGAGGALALAAGVRRLDALRLEVLEQLGASAPSRRRSGLAVELDLEPDVALVRAVLCGSASVGPPGSGARR